VSKLNHFKWTESSLNLQQIIQSSCMNGICWSLKTFSELTPFELYDILRLRSEVFVVEQQCIFLDMDDRDQQAHHLQGRLQDELIASVRILPPGLAYEEPSIGRVVGSPRHRGIGAGKQLMQEAIAATITLYGPQPIKIGAQQYLKKFYEDLGFEQCSDPYLEDDIPHIKMIRNT
jgi:ElaA protein